MTWHVSTHTLHSCAQIARHSDVLPSTAGIKYACHCLCRQYRRCVSCSTQLALLMFGPFVIWSRSAQLLQEVFLRVLYASSKAMDATCCHRLKLLIPLRELPVFGAAGHSCCPPELSRRPESPFAFRGAQLPNVATDLAANALLGICTISIPG